MSPQHILLSIFASAFLSALAMFYWCEFGKGGVRDLQAERDAEVELNVKLLKRIVELGEENAAVRKAHTSIIFPSVEGGFSLRIDGVDMSNVVSDFKFVVDGAGKGERTSVEQSSARPSSTANDEVSAAVEAEKGASAESGPVGARTATAVVIPGHSSPVCDKVGHVWFGGITGSGASYSCTRCNKRFRLPNPDKTCDETGHLFGEEDCIRCGAKQATPADIEQIRSAVS